MFFGVLLLVAVGTFAASFIPFRMLQASARANSARGQVPFFTPGFYHDMQLRLRVMALGNFLIAGVGFVFRERAARIARQVVLDCGQMSSDFRTAARCLPKNEIVAVAVLTVWATVLRLPLLFQPIRGDEAYTFLTYASHPFYVGLSFYNDTNNHLLNTLLMRVSYLLFGSHPWALRLPVFFAGIALVPAAYVAGRCLYSKTSALLGPAFVSTASPLIEYSVNGRGYILMCLECLLLIPFADYALRKRNLAAWAAVVALFAVGFFTIPIMLYPFGGFVAWLLISILADRGISKKRALTDLAVVVVLAGIVSVELYSPVFAISGPHAVFGKKLAAPKPVSQFLYELPGSLVSTWAQWNRDIPAGVTIALVFGFVFALIFHRKLSSQRLPLPLAMLAWFVVVLTLQRVVPFERVWLFALPIFLVVCGAGLGLVLSPMFERVHVRQGVAILAVVTALLLGYQGKRTHSVYLANEGRGMEEVALYLKRQLKPGDSVVAVVPSDTLLLYHFGEHQVPASFLNASGGGQVFVIVDEHEGDTLQKVLETAGRASLESARAKLVAKYETASLYEISREGKTLP